MSELKELKSFKCDTGKITSDSKIITKLDNDIIYDKIGEFFDLYCVAMNKKPLATFDFTENCIRKLRKIPKDKTKTRDFQLINKVIEFSNKKGVKMLYNKNAPSYLNTICYLPKNKNKALKLANILWFIKLTPSHGNYMIGKLLGYSKLISLL